MPDMVPTKVILKSLAEALARVKTEEVWLSFEKFKEVLVASEIYSSDPSIRNAWIRVKACEYCKGSIPGRTPQTKKVLLALSWIRADLGLEVVEDKANEKKKTDAVGAY